MKSPSTLLAKQEVLGKSPAEVLQLNRLVR